MSTRSNKNILKTVLVVLLVLLLLVGAVFLGIALADKGSEPSELPTFDVEGDDWVGNKPGYTGEKNTDTIDIPGFDAMNFKAGEIKQSVNIYNPEQNTCFFKATLYLPDGTAIWQSKLIPPGKAVYQIELNKTLEVGTYENAKLKYECFKLDGVTPLNGAEIKLNINVLK